MYSQKRANLTEKEVNTILQNITQYYKKAPPALIKQVNWNSLNLIKKKLLIV